MTAFFAVHLVLTVVSLTLYLADFRISVDLVDARPPDGTRR